MTCEAQSLHAVALLVLAIWYQSIYLLPKLEYNAVHPYTRSALIPFMSSEILIALHVPEQQLRLLRLECYSLCHTQHCFYMKCMRTRALQIVIESI